jgi:hypothetical protein
MSQVPPTSPYPQPGEVIDGKYKVERVLGQGGMGAVVKAVHLVLRAPVALKFMNPQYVEVQGAVDRFLNEGVASKRIASDHVLHVDDVGKLPSGAPYLVMDCLDGRDLAQVLEAEGKPGLPAMRAVGFVLQILRALQAAHATNIIHRDMKPSNCFVIHKDGDDDFVKILDFGISKIQDPGSQSLTQTHSALGTPLYMSAEQARSPKEVDARSDLYSVAVILYELLSGRTPFRAESGQLTELLFKLFTADPDPLDELVPDLPPGLWDVVRKGLAREPIDRYASALLFAEALEPFTDEKGRALIARMQRFVAPEDAGRASRAIPPSAVAFSELGKGASLGGTPLAGGVSQAQAEAAVRTLGMAGTEVDRRSSVPPPAAGTPPPPPHGPAGTVAMPDRPSAMGGIAAPRVPRENDVTYPRPEGGNLGSSAPALSATQPTRDTQAGSQRMLITGAGIALAAVVVAIGIAKLTAAPVPANVSGEPKPTALPSVATPPPVADKASAAPSTSAAPSATPSASAHAAQPKPTGAAPKPQPTHVLQTGIQN